MSKHTPGPWAVDVPNCKDNAYCGVHGSDGVDGFVLADVLNDGYPEDVQRANALLIAAAPDLLNALENLYALVQGECPSLLEDDHHDVMVSAAIAKAKGES